jgi:hypothetical protein
MDVAPLESFAMLCSLNKDRGWTSRWPTWPRNGRAPIATCRSCASDWARRCPMRCATRCKGWASWQARAARATSASYEQARELYATPDALRDQQRTFVRLKDLAGLSAEIIAARDYLSDVQLRPADQELALDRMAILGQIDLGNLASLLDLLDEDLVTFIQILLAEEEVATSESDLLQRFAAAYPTLEEADLPKALREFDAMLRAAFQEARQANPEKKTVRLTLR